MAYGVQYKFFVTVNTVGYHALAAMSRSGLHPPYYTAHAMRLPGDSHIKVAISSSSLIRLSYLMVVRTSNKMRLRLGLLLWLHLQVLVVMATDADNNYTAPSVINVGLLQPLEGPLGFERTGSAATMAVRDAQSRGYLNQTDVKYSSIHLFISSCCFTFS